MKLNNNLSMPTNFKSVSVSFIPKTQNDQTNFTQETINSSQIKFVNGIPYVNGDEKKPFIGTMQYNNLQGNNIINFDFNTYYNGLVTNLITNPKCNNYWRALRKIVKNPEEYDIVITKCDSGSAGYEFRPIMIKYKKIDGKFIATENIRPIIDNDKLLGLIKTEVDSKTKIVKQQLYKSAVEEFEYNTVFQKRKITIPKFELVWEKTGEKAIPMEKIKNELKNNTCIGIETYEYSDMPGVTYNLDKSFIDSFYTEENGKKKINLDKLVQEIPNSSNGIEARDYINKVCKFIHKIVNPDEDLERAFRWVLNGNYGMNRNIYNNVIVLETLNSFKDKKVTLQEVYKALITNLNLMYNIDNYQNYPEDLLDKCISSDKNIPEIETTDWFQRKLKIQLGEV